MKNRIWVAYKVIWMLLWNLIEDWKIGWIVVVVEVKVHLINSWTCDGWNINGVNGKPEWKNWIVRLIKWLIIVVWKLNCVEFGNRKFCLVVQE